MSAEIILIGPFSPDIAGFLDYPPERYAATKKGAIVSRRLFGVSEGSSVSRKFAAYFGISDPWDFNQHQIACANIDLVGLTEFGQIYDHYAHDVAALEALMRAGFTLHFRPEG